MNQKRLISLVSQNTALPTPKVAKVADEMFRHLSELIEHQGRFSSPRLKIAGFVVPAKVSDTGTVERPQRHAARIRARRRPTNNEASAIS